jgi:hypothetical protein
MFVSKSAASIEREPSRAYVSGSGDSFGLNSEIEINGSAGNDVFRGIEHLWPSDLGAERCIGGVGGAFGWKEITKE